MKIFFTLVFSLFLCVSAFAQTVNLPDAPEHVSAGDNAVPVFGNANRHGVFPVEIEWNPVPGAAFYSLWCSKEEENAYTLIAANVTAPAFTDSQPESRPGEIYFYKIQAHDAEGNAGEFSAPDSGYGALTSTAFFLEYAKSVKESHNKLTLMHNKGMKALGTETISGESGRVSYSAQAQGLRGLVELVYTGYAEFGSPFNSWYFSLSGTTFVSVNMAKNGSMSGRVEADGMYPGTVIYDDLGIVKGEAGSGWYTVSQASGQNGRVSWDSGL